jgi:hypothetical protein
MRPVNVNPNNLQAAVIELAQASKENDIVDVAQNFDFDVPPTQTTTLNLSAPTLANVAAVVGTLLQIMQKGGINRST